MAKSKTAERKELKQLFKTAFERQALIQAAADKAGDQFIKQLQKEAEPIPAGEEGVPDRQAISKLGDVMYNAAKAEADRLGYKGVVIVEVNANKEAAVPKTKKEQKAQQKPEKETARKTEAVETEHGEFRKGTVFYAIYRAFQLKDGLTKEQILDRLCEEFPDRKREDMASTINTQINRMPKERGFHLGRDDKGRYSVHIKERSRARILGPEAQAKLEEKRKAKEKKEAEKAAKAKAKEEEKAKKAEAKKAALAKAGIPTKEVA